MPPAVIGTGAYGKLPVTPEIKREAERRRVELVIVPTAAAIEELRGNTKGAIYAFLSLMAMGRSLSGGRRREARIDSISRSKS